MFWFFDMHYDNDKKLEKGKVPGIECMEVLYADDTLLICKDTKTANLFLKLIEPESAYHGLNLNKSKCNFIRVIDESKMKSQI